MKVLHVITSLNRGGAEIHLLNLVSEQIKNGYKVQVIFWKGNGKLVKYFKKLNVKSYCLNKNKFFFEKLLLLNFIFSCFRLSKKIDVFKPDLLHAHLPFSEVISFINLFFRKKIKFIITKHLDTVYFSKDNKRKSLIGNYLERTVSKRAHKIICISNAVKKFMLSKYMGIKKKKLVKIYYGLDFNLYNEDQKNQKLLKLKKKFSNQQIIGTISRLVPQKRLDRMIKIFKDFNKKYNPKSKLIIIGQGPEEKNLKLFAKSINIEKKIIWIKYVDDIRSFFKLIDVFCLTSEHEGFGIVLLEAFHNKKPVICNNKGSLPEIITNGFNGFCLDKNKIENFSKKLNFLLKKNNRLYFIKNAHQILNNKFTNKKMFLKTDRIYRLT